MKFRNIEKDKIDQFIDKEEAVIKLKQKKEDHKVNYYLLHNFSVYIDSETIGKGFFLRDITKEEEIDTLKNNLISLTSHEFKTPITNIRGSVETLLRQDVEWDESFKRELLEGVHEDIERIQHLVNDWMDISKIESGTMFIERHKIRIDEVIEESMSQIPLELQNNLHMTFHNHLDDTKYFYGDKLRIQQVLINLFTNAIRYNDSHIKKIIVMLEEIQEEIIIKVMDNGIGISPDHIDKIFTRFYQVDNTATRRTGGTGLGLAICKGIMEAHGGRIEVKSKKNIGSTFTLYFPKGKESYE